jgi:MFS family permease
VPDYRSLISAWLLIGMAHRMQVVTLGWHLYERTGSPMAIAFIGLSQAIPSVVMALPAGQMVDRYDRRGLLLLSGLVSAIAALALVVAAAADMASYWLYLGSFVGAAAQVVNRPARNAILPSVVPASLLPSAVSWSAGTNQLAAVMGPSIAGILIASTGGALAAYSVVAGANVLALVLTLRMRPHATPKAPEETRGLQHLLAGMVHIMRTPVLMSSIVLDMVQVMFSGAMGLLPVFAKDILHGGPEVLGWLASAPAVGAVVMVVVLNHLPTSQRPGRRFLWAVAGYGLACMLFGLSTQLELSLLALFVMGALNSISAVTRHTMLQAYTPAHMRGRVSSANGIFSGGCSELGQFEAGALASLTTPVFAVVAGGAFTIAAAAFAAQRFPELRRLTSLTLN